ncbi:MAG: phage tail sheath C-terminal domain-containing protein [Emergencia sp.]|nr:phage tail sheath C-terminal domain-containing protein [Emergencia sp.]
MGLPNIVVTFKEKAATAITRSERGIVCLVMNDATKTDPFYEYRSILDVSEEDWSEDNLKALKDAFLDGPSKVYAVRLETEKKFSDAEAALDKIKINWLAYIGADQTGVADYVKKRNMKPVSAAIKAVVHSQTADDIHVVDFANTKVKRKGEEEIEGYKYLGRIAGMLAALPMTRSCTYYKFDDLESVTDAADIDAAVDKGEFVLFNDYGTVKAARGVNSATTIENPDLKKITIIEGMDLMKEDIIETFKAQYVGQYKNNLDNQSVFLASVNTYYRQLAHEQILDSGFSNLAQIDTEKQRQAWVNSGKTEAMDWDDETVKKNTFRSNVYLKGNVKFLDAIEDLEFDIFLN